MSLVQPYSIAIIYLHLVSLTIVSTSTDVMISPHLHYFLDSTLEGCTIRVIMEQSRKTMEEIYAKLNEHLNVPTYPKGTYLVDSYVNNSVRVFRTKFGKLGYEFDNYTEPTWQDKKHSVCYAHLYFIENWKDLRDAVTFHFVDFDLRLEAPTFIIFWSVNKKNKRYEKYFMRREFHGSFMDYRMLIGTSEANVFELSIICIYCKQEKKYFAFYPFPTTQLPTKAIIHDSWKNFHFKSHQHRDIYCEMCEFIKRKGKNSKLTMAMYLMIVLNASSYKPTGEIIYRYEASMSSFIPKATFLAENYISPSFVLSPSFLRTFDFKMFTVVRKSSMLHVGWIAIFTPFQIFG